MLLTDSKLSGTYTSGIYTNIYILGHKFTNIVEGLGVLMIVQGSLEFLLNTTSFISDVVLHSKSKSILVRNSDINTHCIILRDIPNQKKKRFKIENLYKMVYADNVCCRMMAVLNYRFVELYSQNYSQQPKRCLLHILFTNI